MPLLSCRFTESRHGVTAHVCPANATHVLNVRLSSFNSSTNPSVTTDANSGSDERQYFVALVVAGSVDIRRIVHCAVNEVEILSGEKTRRRFGEHHL
jgi:hypothetical protein